MTIYWLDVPALLYPLGQTYLGTWGYWEEVALPGGRALAGNTYGGKIKFQICHLFLYVPKFYCFYIEPNVFVYKITFSYIILKIQ